MPPAALAEAEPSLTARSACISSHVTALALTAATGARPALTGKDAINCSKASPLLPLLEAAAGGAGGWKPCKIERCLSGPRGPAKPMSESSCPSLSTDAAARGAPALALLRKPRPVESFSRVGPRCKADGPRPGAAAVVKAAPAEDPGAAGVSSPQVPDSTLGAGGAGAALSKRRRETSCDADASLLSKGAGGIEVEESVAGVGEENRERFIPRHQKCY